jgi:UDP-glucuronate decarboxylase
MKYILITGGCGFIGSNLCCRLIEESKENFVICVDDLTSGYYQNVRVLENNNRFVFINFDIVDDFEKLEELIFENVNKKFKDNGNDLLLYQNQQISGIFPKISQIYHLASYASPVKYMEEPVKTLETCFNGTHNVIKLALKHVGCRILFSSTSEIYGEPLEHPQKETYFGNVNPIGPRSQYDEGKRVAEALLMTYFNRFNLDVRIARLFNTYGPKMAENDGRVVSNFVMSLLQRKPVTIYGNGEQTRSFCYIDDTVSGLITLMNNTSLDNINMDNVEKRNWGDELFNGWNGRIFNIGNPQEITINQLYEKLFELMNIGDDGYRIDDMVEYIEKRENDPLVRKPDITLAQKYLDWQPFVPLEDGLRQTIGYFLL